MFHELCRLNKMCAPQIKDSVPLPGRPFSLWLFSSSGSAASFLGILRAPLFLFLTTQCVIPLLCPGLTTDSFSSTKNTPGESQGVLDELLGISLGKFRN